MIPFFFLRVITTRGQKFKRKRARRRSVEARRNAGMPRAPAARAPRPVARLPAHRRRAYDEHTRWEVVWCLLATGACSARETQEAIARTGTPLEGAHAVPSLSTIRRIRRRYRETGPESTRRGRGAGQ